MFYLTAQGFFLQAVVVVGTCELRFAGGCRCRSTVFADWVSIGATCLRVDRTNPDPGEKKRQGHARDPKMMWR